ncbi:MAG: response regulator [Gammaproteobacteria bacterium]
MDYLLQFTSLSNFMPHGMCYMWRWDLLLLHVGSDVLIAAAYFSIPAAMLVLVRKRPEIPAKIILLFVAFILLCGITHVINIIVVWYPAYGIQGIFKLATGIVSVITAAYLWPLIPKIVAMPSMQDLEKRNVEIETLNKKLESRLESLSTLAGGVSHEFNNLLTIISGNVELLQDEIDALDSRDKLAAIGQSSARAADVCNKMLAYSGKGHFVLSEFNLAEFVAGIEIVTPPGFHLESSIEPLVKPINGSKKQIDQMLRLLVSNAIEALEESRKASKRVTITVHSRYLDTDDLQRAAFECHAEPGDFVLLEIADNANGMSKEVFEHLFDPYFTTRFTGRGLGLSAVQGIVRGHGGCMFVETQIDEGSTMIVAFPVVAAKTCLFREPIHPRPRLALVVDDEESILDLAESYFAKLGIKAITTSDTEVALNLVEAHQHELDLVVLDYLMPRMTGLELLERIAGIVTVDAYLTSGYTRGEIGEEAVRSRLTGFIAKPFDMGDFRRLFAGEE